MVRYPNSECDAHRNIKTSAPVCIVCMIEEIERLRMAIQQRDEALNYLMQQFDGEVWNCPQCGHAESTDDTDSAIWLRDWLATHNVDVTGAEPASSAERPR